MEGKRFCCTSSGACSLTSFFKSRQSGVLSCESGDATRLSLWLLKFRLGLLLEVSLYSLRFCLVFYFIRWSESHARVLLTVYSEKISRWKL